MIAIVDDDVCFAEETQELLYSVGFQAVVVITHPHDSSMALLEHARLLVLDLDLNGTSGVSILQSPQCTASRPCILLVSGSGRADLDHASEIASRDGYRVLGALEKPVPTDEFIELVRLFKLPSQHHAPGSMESEPNGSSILAAGKGREALGTFPGANS